MSLGNVWLSPCSVTVALLTARPVNPVTVTVLGYGAAGVGGLLDSFIAMKVAFEKVKEAPSEASAKEQRPTKKSPPGTPRTAAKHIGYQNCNSETGHCRENLRSWMLLVAGC